MVSIFELIKDEKEKIEKINKLRSEVVEEKMLLEKNKASLYFSIDFKAKGATTDKLRDAAVKQALSGIPNQYEEKKVELDSLMEELKFLRQTIEVMKNFNVEEIDL